MRAWWMVLTVSSLGLLLGCSASSGGGGGDFDRYGGDAGPTADPGDDEGGGAAPPGDSPQADAGAGTGDGSGGAASETCGNGLDDDADGEVDEGCGCAVGESQDCYGGPLEAAGVGACVIGTQSCDPAGEFGSWGECAGWTGPVDESCNGVDDDCDGTADEGCACTLGETRSCYTGPAGTEGVGICAAGTQECVGDGWGECTGSTLPDVERCNGADDDCDGEVDEGCGCTPGDTRSCYEHPDGTPGEGTPGVGLCREGIRTCEELPGGGSDWGDCTGATFPLPESCDDGTDEDCDGEVDEGCEPPGEVDCTVADVLFLVDTTGSMGGEIFQIQTRLRDTIIPGLAREIGDVRFSVARFDDFPVGGYGGGADIPFALLQQNTSSEAAAQSAVDRLSASGGSDGPESQVEALYQTATGSGIGTWVPGASCPAGTVGYPCFRAGATHIVLLFTDNEFHNGPGGANPYSGIFPSPHDYAQAVSELGRIDAKVLGLYSGFAGRTHLEAVARDTGALRADGSPIVIDIGSDGSGLDSGVISAVSSLCAD